MKILENLRTKLKAWTMTFKKENPILDHLWINFLIVNALLTCNLLHFSKCVRTVYDHTKSL